MASDSIFSLASRSLKLTTAADIEPHLALLEASDGVTTIDLTGNTIGVEASERLAAVLSKQKSLHTVKFDDIFTSRLLSEIPPSLDALLTSLLQCPKLEAIDLSDNAFGLNTVEPLVKFLRQHVPLKHLFLNNNGLGPKAGALVAEALTELAQRKEEARVKGQDVPDLETVVCGRNRLESGSAAAWAKAYRAHPNVRTVKMVQNGIRPDGVVLLIQDGLAYCSKLRTLDLQDNTFTVTGARALSRIVGNLQELEVLGVSDALLKPRGALAVMEALSEKEHKSLKTIKLQYAEMDRRGLKVLIGAIKAGSLPVLQRTELNGNKFPEDDELVLELRETLDKRREAAGGDEDDETWGIDELDEMESDEEEEEEEEGEDEHAGPADDSDDEEEPQRPARGESLEEKQDREKAGERMLKSANDAESEPVAERDDKDVDDLADALKQTNI